MLSFIHAQRLKLIAAPKGILIDHFAGCPNFRGLEGLIQTVNKDTPATPMPHQEPLRYGTAWHLPNTKLFTDYPAIDWESVQNFCAGCRTENTHACQNAQDQGKYAYPRQAKNCDALVLVNFLHPDAPASLTCTLMRARFMPLM